MASTIAAIATGIGGGIGIVRVSGPGAASIGQKVCFPWPAVPTSHHLYVGQIRDEQGELIDQVLFCLMKGPRSYTGEDTLEIHGHGGRVGLARIFDEVQRAGAVPAGPGEFTRRAFLAGKLDLTQAEAIAAAISAQTLPASRQAQRQLHGELGQAIRTLRTSVTDLLARIEGALDFPELAGDGAGQIEVSLAQLVEKISGLVASFDRGQRMHAGAHRVALLGLPNTGKSSLLNALCQSERVLVDSAPGTTRDYVEVRTEWDGIAIALLDTAGQTEAGSALEQRGLALARQRYETADLVLFVVDGTRGFGPAEEQYLAGLPHSLPWLLIWNKVDQEICLPPPPSPNTLCCSALCGWGLGDLRHRVSRMLAGDDSSQLLVTSARQAAALTDATRSLRQAMESLNRDEWDLVASDLRDCSGRLGHVMGEDVPPDVLDAIFAQFCVGK